MPGTPEFDRHKEYRLTQRADVNCLTSGAPNASVNDGGFTASVDLTMIRPAKSLYVF
jgi:hypothetical protein